MPKRAYNCGKITSGIMINKINSKRLFSLKMGNEFWVNLSLPRLILILDVCKLIFYDYYVTYIFYFGAILKNWALDIWIPC